MTPCHKLWIVAASMGIAAGLGLAVATAPVACFAQPTNGSTAELQRLAQAPIPVQPVFAVGQSVPRILLALASTPPNLEYPQFVQWHLRTFEGALYGGGGKGCPPNATVVNAEVLDCVTFTETLLALWFTYDACARQPTRCPDSLALARFVDQLNHIRYYNGQNSRGEDRYHYFTDALRVLKARGLLTDVGAQAGVPFTKPINYISTHPKQFHDLRDWASIRRVEQRLSHTERWYFPLDSLAVYERLAQTGDIVALATNVPGLDVSHVGVVTCSPGSPLCFTHASSVAGQLVVEQGLREYLDRRTTITGVVVYRPVYAYDHP